MMSLISEIAQCSSLSIVGLEKNTGKTECLNYILRNLPDDCAAAVTSTGVDGETIDRVTLTPKPEIRLRRGMLFATSENDYASRKLVSELLAVGDRSTATGRIVTARALSDGKVELSGPSSVAELSRWIDSLHDYGVGLTLIDGAISRMSSASPAVSEAMVLSTGAAVSANISELVRQTAWAVEKIRLPLADCSVADDLTIASLADADNIPTERLQTARRIAVAGALTDSVLERISSCGTPAVVVEDFTKVFCSQQTFRRYLKAGGKVEVRRRSKLLAVCVNPVSPNGVRLDSERVCKELKQATEIETYDILKQ